MLSVLILVGSRNLAHFDAALVGYTFSVLFATFGLTYRYALWLQRPPTALYWRRGWQAFFRRGWRRRNAGTWVRRVGEDVLANRFIFARDRLRGLTHLLIMWGCLIAVAITFPLVFGWLHFRPVPGDLSLYEAVTFGFPAFQFPHDSAIAFFLFHGLVWSSFLVIAGVMLAVRRRMREEGAVAVQRFAEDFMPLILLFAVSLTGLMLTASYTWMKGYAYTFIAILHAITVIGSFVYAPYSHEASVATTALFVLLGQAALVAVGLAACFPRHTVDREHAVALALWVVPYATFGFLFFGADSERRVFVLPAL